MQPTPSRPKSRSLRNPPTFNNNQKVGYLSVNDASRERVEGHARDDTRHGRAGERRLIEVGGCAYERDITKQETRGLVEWLGRPANEDSGCAAPAGAGTFNAQPRSATVAPGPNTPQFQASTAHWDGRQTDSDKSQKKEASLTGREVAPRAPLGGVDLVRALHGKAVATAVDQTLHNTNAFIQLPR